MRLLHLSRVKHGSFRGGATCELSFIGQVLGLEGSGGRGQDEGEAEDAVQVSIFIPRMNMWGRDCTYR